MSGIGKDFFVLLLAVILIAQVLNIGQAAPRSEPTASSVGKESSSSDVFRSDISLPVTQNATVSLSNATSIEASSLMAATTLSIDVARGFQPTERFGGQFYPTLTRYSNVRNSSLENVDGNLFLRFEASNLSEASIAAYNLTFLSPERLSATDYLSIAFSTSSYDIRQAYVGVSLILRDESGNHRFVSVEVSGRYQEESYEMSSWFLGWGFSRELLEYPHYSFEYGSTFGAWFKQVSLSQAFAGLNVSTAWLDGMIIGGEIFSTPVPYTLSEMNVTLNYIRVHANPFSVNQQIINSTQLILPYQKSLNFSGIVGESVDVSMQGHLKPNSDAEKRSENNTIAVREVFYNLSKAEVDGIVSQGNLNLTVFSKSVKNCFLTFDEINTEDLTDTLLSTNTALYLLPSGVRTVRVALTLYKYNTWIFALSFFDIIDVTKSGIVEERFSATSNEGEVVVQLPQARRNTYLAVKVDSFESTSLWVNGEEKPLESVIVLGKETCLMIPLEFEQSTSQFAVKYRLFDDPVYQSLTKTPFKVYHEGSFFSIYTPFTFESEISFHIPLTVQMLTSKTFSLAVEYDRLFFETERSQILAYASRFHYEYFMLKPLQTGQSVVNLIIADPATGATIFSASFFAIVYNSLYSTIAHNALLAVTLFSVFAASLGALFVKHLPLLGRKSVDTLPKGSGKTKRTFRRLPSFPKHFPSNLRSD